MILSYHPCYVGDENRLCAGRHPDDNDAATMRSADAIILPQGCSAPLFEMAASNCKHVFPDYTNRFRFPGKIGQASLFRHYKVAHPETLSFESMAMFHRQFEPGKFHSPLGYPFVFKFSWSGEGKYVWRVDDLAAFQLLTEKAVLFESTGQNGFLLQRYIETHGRSLRVVVINETCIAYWRIQPDPARFGSQCAQGATIDYRLHPVLQKKAIVAVLDFCKKTGINLAGFDIIFDVNDPSATPLFLEINYYFGRRGLGGSEGFYQILCPEIDRWLSGLNFKI